MKPSVGRVVHYVSYGTPGGEYPKTCRAATIAEVGAWIDTGITEHGDGTRTVRQRWDPEAVALVVLNPTGQFFNQICQHEELPPAERITAGERTTHRGGTWHWPERIE